MGNEFSEPKSSYVDNNTNSVHTQKFLSSVCIKPKKLLDHDIPENHIRINSNLYKYAQAFVQLELKEYLVPTYTCAKKTFFIKRSADVDEGEYEHRAESTANLFLPFIIDIQKPLSRIMISVDFGALVTKKKPVSFDEVAARTYLINKSKGIRVPVLDDAEWFYTKGAAAVDDDSNILLYLRPVQMSVEMDDGCEYNVNQGRIIDSTEIIWGSRHNLIFVKGVNNSPRHFNKEDYLKVKEEIAGQDEIIDHIYQNIIVPRTLPKQFISSMDIVIPVGAVFEGPKGNGKSALAETIAKNLHCFYKVIKGPELKSCLVGSTEKAIRSLFAAPAEEYEQAGPLARLYIILLDEMESMCPRRQMTEHGNDNSITNTMLACVEGNRLPPNVIIFGTTNRIEMVDPAFLREGRLGIIYNINNPDARQRRAIISLYMDKLPAELSYTSNGKTLSKHELECFKERLADTTCGLTGSDIRAAVSRTKMNFLQNNISGDKISGVKTIDVELFMQELTERKQKVDVFPYYLWNEELKNFTHMVIKRFRNSAPGVSATYKVAGHGLATLVRYIAREIQIDNFITDRVADNKILDSVIIVQPGYTFNVDLFKLKGKRTIVFKRVGEEENYDNNNDFVIRDIASLEEYHSLMDMFNLGETFMTDALSFPMPFSRLFRFLKTEKAAPPVETKPPVEPEPPMKTKPVPMESDDEWIEKSKRRRNIRGTRKGIPMN